jgi:hypothetical protein
VSKPAAHMLSHWTVRALSVSLSLSLSLSGAFYTVRSDDNADGDAVYTWGMSELGQRGQGVEGDGTELWLPGRIEALCGCVCCPVFSNSRLLLRAAALRCSLQEEDSPAGYRTRPLFRPDKCVTLHHTHTHTHTPMTAELHHRRRRGLVLVRGAICPSLRASRTELLFRGFNEDGQTGTLMRRRSDSRSSLTRSRAGHDTEEQMLSVPRRLQTLPSGCALRRIACCSVSCGQHSLTHSLTGTE